MSDIEEKRICKQCGMRLPSSNNYCMYCGCNNDLENRVVQGLNSENEIVQNQQEPIVERQKNSLLNKLIYVFIFLDIIVISFFFIDSYNGMFYDVFPYNLNKYDKVLNIDNNSFLALKDNKVKVLGESEILEQAINKITEDKVLDIGESYPGSGYFFIEVNNKIYSISSSGYLNELEIKKQTGDVYKDLKDSYIYHSLIGENYFIKNDALYFNERTGYYFSVDYTSKLIMDKKELDLKNATIIGSENDQKNIAVRGDNAIKLFSDGKLVKSIRKVTYRNKEYLLSDFKYIFCNDGYLLFVHKNGNMIKYNSNIFRDVKPSNDSEYIFYFYQTEDAGSLKNDNLIINNNDKSVIASSKYIKMFSLLNKKSIVIVSIVFLVVLIILFALLYIFRNTKFFMACLINTGYLFVVFFILLLYMKYKDVIPTAGEAVKTAFELIPSEFLASLIITQVRDITKYILYKFNIETIYHFILLIISSFSFLLAVGLLTGNLYFLAIIPGFVWAFLTFNDETYIEYNLDKKSLIKVVVVVCGNLLLALVLSLLLHIPEYYLYILVVSFCLSCYLVLKDDSNIIDHFKRLMLSNVSLLLVLIITIIIELANLSKIDGAYSNASKEVAKYIIGTQFIRVIYIIFISFVLAIIILIIQSLLKSINKIDNRILRIFVMMFIAIVFVIVVIILVPYMHEFYKIICDIFIDINTTTDTSLYRFLS